MGCGSTVGWWVGVAVGRVVEWVVILWLLPLNCSVKRVCLYDVCLCVTVWCCWSAVIGRLLSVRSLYGGWSWLTVCWWDVGLSHLLIVCSQSACYIFALTFLCSFHEPVGCFNVFCVVDGRWC